MSPKLKQNYRALRARGRKALDAVTMARAEVTAGRTLYMPDGSITYNPPCSKIHGESHVRWIENVTGFAGGLRLVGFADEILPHSIKHRGWYTDENGDRGTMRGVVYQLPSRKGVERFAYGYADPNNDGAALLSFDPCDDKEDAARWADQFAERCAEEEREYQAAWSAGSMWEQSGTDLSKARRAVRELLAELKTDRPKLGPQACAALLGAVRSKLEALNDLRCERAKLASGEGLQGGLYWYWNASDKRLREAFNEGAGRAVVPV